MRLRRVLAKNLVRVRGERSLSQEALAFAADVDRSYISLIENARYAVSIDLLEKLARALNVKPGDLLS